MVLFGILFVSSFTPTIEAAKKTLIQKGITTLTGSTSVCDVPVNLRGEAKFSTTMWDNGNFNSHWNYKGTVNDSVTGEEIGNFKRIENTHGSQEDLPMTVQINQVITCKGLGVERSTHVGCTIHKDGTITCHGGFINF